MTHKNQVRVVWKEVWSFVSSFLKFLLRTVLSHWDFSNWRFRFFPPLKSNCDSHTMQPTVHAGCFSVSIIHRTLTWTSGPLTRAQVLMDAIAHGGVRTPQESLHWKLTREKNPLPHRGIEPASAACRSNTLSTELHPRPFQSPLLSVSLRACLRQPVSCSQHCSRDTQKKAMRSLNGLWSVILYQGSVD